MKKLTTLLFLCLGFLLSTAYAQEAPLILTRGTSASNTLDAENVARVYFFVGVQDEVVTVTANGEDDLNLGLIVTAPDGTILAQGVANEQGETTLEGITLTTSANFYVAVFASGEVTEGTFSLLLVNNPPATNEITEVPAETTAESTAESTQFGTQPTPQGTDSTAGTQEPVVSETGFSQPVDRLFSNGLQISLSWSANVDLNLEVRDPIGNTLYFDSRTSPTGGEFGFDANGFCQVISPNPTETATWAPGFLPTGSYEILVFYRQACEQPVAVNFTTTVTINGQTLQPQTGTINPPISQNQSSVYLTSFSVTVDSAGALTGMMNAGGEYPSDSLNVVVAPLADYQASAVEIVRDVSQTGAVFGDRVFTAYRFEAQANDLITASANALNGSLDTLLQLTDANGNLIAVNDDSNNTRNSQISDIRLSNAGTYYLLVTRYGKQVGGSEGDFTVALTTGTATLPPEILSLNLDPGDIQVILTWSSPADLQLLVRDPVGDSVFDDSPFSASGGELLLDGNVNCRAPSANLSTSYIRWPEGFTRPGNYETEVWYQNDCANPGPVEFTLSIVVNGQVISVTRQVITVNQRYLLSFNVLPDGNATSRLGGVATNQSSSVNWQAEVPVPILPNQPIIGQISDTNVFDVYSINLIQGQNITIVDAASSPTLDTKLFLVGPSGLQVAENDDAGPASPTQRRSDAVIANFIAAEPGTYIIIATRYGTVFGGTIGSYTLTVTTQ
jgi:hypothetical protein